MRDASSATKSNVALAISHLKAERTALREADCPRTLAKVRAAIKSADGARRHVDHRAARAGR